MGRQDRSCFYSLRIYTTLKLCIFSIYIFYSFYSLRIYTTLKHGGRANHRRRCFYSLRIYTTLKHTVAPCRQVPRFYSLRIYTTLKLLYLARKKTPSFYSLRIYTTLKLPSSRIKPLYVSIPYEFTLLSNYNFSIVVYTDVSIPYEFTLLSNTGMPQRISHQFLFPTNLHYSQTMSDSDLHDLSFYSLRIYTTLKQKDWRNSRA